FASGAVEQVRARNQRLDRQDARPYRARQAARHRRRGDRVKRREFIRLLSSAAAWPLAARAQQPERMRRIGMLAVQAKDDPDMQVRLDAFRHGLQGLGWVEGRNVHIDYRFADGRADRFQPLAKELVALKPELIFAQGTPGAAAAQRESRTLPIVF